MLKSNFVTTVTRYALRGKTTLDPWLAASEGNTALVATITPLLVYNKFLMYCVSKGKFYIRDFMLYLVFVTPAKWRHTRIHRPNAKHTNHKTYKY